MSMEKSFQLRNKLDKNNEAQLEADLLNNSVGPSVEGSTASVASSASDVDSFLHNSGTLHQILHALNPKGTAGQDNALGDSERDINSSVTDTPRQRDIVDIEGSPTSSKKQAGWRCKQWVRGQVFVEPLVIVSPKWGLD